MTARRVPDRELGPLGSRRRASTIRTQLETEEAAGASVQIVGEERRLVQ